MRLGEEPELRVASWFLWEVSAARRGGVRNTRSDRCGGWCGWDQRGRGRRVGVKLSRRDLLAG